MSAIRQKIIIVFFLVAILTIQGKVYAQQQSADSVIVVIVRLDTSDYIPASYKGSLDYNLMIASARGYPTEVERLISKGADIDAETNEGATPLIFAVSNNRLMTVKTILGFYPILNKVTSAYETPLLIAVKNRNFEMTETLIRAGADPDHPDNHGATPLHHAALNGYTEIVDLLLYYDATKDVRSGEGTTPLLAAIWAGYIDVGDLLIKKGADIETSDNEGITPFLLASYFGDTVMMDILHKKGADIYATNKVGHNAFSLAIIANQDPSIRFLLRTGNNWGNSRRGAFNLYSVASKYRRPEMMKILKDNNIPGHFKYEIDQVAFSASSRFFIDDLYTGASLSFKEPYINGGIIIGLDTKLWYTKVLIKNSERSYYQFFDKGSVAYAGLFKDFALTDNTGRLNYILSGSLSAGYSFGNRLKGSMINPGNKFRVIPAISLKMTKLNFSFNIGMEYVNTEFYHNGPVWFRLGLSYNYFFDNIRTIVKPIKWY